MIASISFCPASTAALPKYGRSAFVRRAVLFYAASGAAPASEGEAPAAPTPMLPVAVAPVPVPADPVKPYNPAEWVRDGLKPDLKDGPYETSLLRYRKENGRSVCVNPPPWPAVPGMDSVQKYQWLSFIEAWKWPEHFPSPLEWLAMGKPEKPLPVHRRAVEPAIVEPDVVEPDVVEPDVVPVVAVNPPLQGGGVSGSVLEEI